MRKTYEKNHTEYGKNQNHRKKNIQQYKQLTTNNTQKNKLAIETKPSPVVAELWRIYAEFPEEWPGQP